MSIRLQSYLSSLQNSDGKLESRGVFTLPDPEANYARLEERAAIRQRYLEGRVDVWTLESERLQARQQN